MAPTNNTSGSMQHSSSKGNTATPLKAKTQHTKARVQRYLKSTEPQLRETFKTRLLLKGIKCSQSMQSVLQELRTMTTPHAKLLSKKNQIASMEIDGQQSLEFLCQKNDAALLAVASHNKKRPNHLTLGRTYDRQILDLAELAVLRFKSMKDYGGGVPKKRIGSKPLILFVGDVWQQSLEYRNLQNLLVDFYRGDVVDKLVVSGLDHLMVFTAAPLQPSSAAGLGTGLSEGSAGSSTTTASSRTVVVHQRTYFCKLKKVEHSATPAPLLIPCGPDMDFSLKRTQWAETDLYKASRKQPFALKAKKRKNQTTNVFGETMGRLHLEKQNVDKMHGRKSKALRRAEKIAAEEESAAIENDLESERRQESGHRGTTPMDDSDDDNSD